MISAEAARQVDAALAAFRERVRVNAEAAASTSSTLASWWGSLIGAESSQAAVRSSAHGDEQLLAAYQGRAARMSSDADAAALVDDIGRELGRPDLRAAAELLTITGAAKDVGGATAKDLGRLAADVGGSAIWLLRAAPFALAAYAAWWVYRVTSPSSSRRKA